MAKGGGDCNNGAKQAEMAVRDGRPGKEPEPDRPHHVVD